MSDAALLGLRTDDLAPGRPYVERDEVQAPWHDRVTLALWHGVLRPALQPLWSERRQRDDFVAQVDQHADALAALDDAALRRHAAGLGRRLRARGFARDTVAECFGAVREAAGRVIGKRHYPVQLAVGWLLLRGTLVEMATGEGKTLAATLPAVTAALAGLPVHVITVNDYLAARDAEAMAPLYRFFGLAVGAVVHGMTREQRRAAYAGAIAYVSNKELAFDYLRDRAALGDRASPIHLAVRGLHGQAAHGSPPCVLRGLVFGIVDEADSVFIDEARTPLILSSTTGQGPSAAGCDAALAWARRLQATLHFELQPASRRLRLTDAGRDALADWREGSDEAALFESVRSCEQEVQRGLVALHLYARDQHYVVAAGKVQIVDEATGRVMADRSWEQGLHQMIEAKEGVALTGLRETLARITYQRLFRRYLRLAGMTGTATEVAAEIGRTYSLPVRCVPLHRPLQRLMLPTCCLADADAKWQAVVERVVELAVKIGRPVLVGTRTVQASEQLSAQLQARGIVHVVLNAKQDADEAVIVARAGERGAVTVATNLAGRGTDILLADGVAELGGLHVILTEYHESPRVDRQLFGRCARQGDRGSAQAIVALDDALFATQAPLLQGLLAARARSPGRLALALLRRLAQSAAERHNRDQRAASLAQDRQFARWLSFTGRGE